MVRITRFLSTVLILIATLGVSSANAQTVSFKNFSSFQNIVPGVDFFAVNRQTIAPYEEASAQAVAKLKNLLGDDLPKGAIFICTNLAQRDSLYEPVVMRQGYSWVLISTTAEVRIQEQLDRLKSQMGDNIPEEIRQRINNMPRDMAAAVDRQSAVDMAKKIAFAVLQTVKNDENFQFRASRADDVAKSILQDWLDIGIGAYASGDRSAVRYLQENPDMAFTLEDVLYMARPFVGNSANQGGFPGGGEGGFPGGGEGGFPGGGQGGFPGGGQGGFPGGGQGGGQGGFPGGGQGGGQGGGRGQGAPKSKPNGDGGQQRTMSKDEQDRMIFDGQAIAFFDYFLENGGIEKMRELIKFVYEKNESWDYVTRPDVLGRDFTKIESNLNEWLMKQSIPDSKPKFDPDSKPKFNPDSKPKSNTDSKPKSKAQR